MTIYNCPISNEIPHIPVINNDGRTYDFLALGQLFLQSGELTDPISNVRIDTLTYNRAIKQLNEENSENVVPFTHEQKNQIRSVYKQLINRFPELKLFDLHAIDEFLINKANKEGKTALHIAAQDGLIEGINILLADPQIEPNLQDKVGYTPLHIVASLGNLEIVQALLAHSQIDPNLQDKDGYTPLHIAVSLGNLEIIQALLAHSQIVPNLASRKHMYTPLSLACQNGRLDIVEVLLAYPGIDPNERDNVIDSRRGKIPLYIASMSNHVEIVKKLLEHPEIDPNFLVPLSRAVNANRIDIVELLLEHPDIDPNKTSGLDTNVLLLQAIQRKDDNFAENKISRLNIVKKLLAHPKIDPNQTDILACIQYLHNTYEAYYLNLDIFDILLIHQTKSMIKNPQLAREAFAKDSRYCPLLKKYNLKIWNNIKDQKMDLSEDKYRELLQAILDSHTESNPAARHPLYTLFSQSNIIPFFSRNILGEVKEQLKTLTRAQDFEQLQEPDHIPNEQNQLCAISNKI